MVEHALSCALLCTGVGADFNMLMWSALSTNTTSLLEYVQQYTTYFFGSAAAPAMAATLYGLEGSWTAAPLQSNPYVSESLSNVRAASIAAPSLIVDSWRLQVQPR